MRTNTTAKFLNILKFFAIAIALSFGLSYALAWTPPPSNPPSGNAPAPITTSLEPQTKLGTLTVGSLTVTGALYGTGDICTSVNATSKCLSSLTTASSSNQYTGQWFLIRALHTFTDCTTAGGVVYNIDEAKNICRLASLLAGWTQYPSNWSTTQNVYCVNTASPPGGWDAPPTAYPCNTGSHTFSDTAIESCVARTVGTYAVCDYRNSFYGCFSDPIETSTTCYATVTERGAY